MTDIDRGIVSIIFVPRIIAPRRIPIAVVPVVVTATDQLYPSEMRVIPATVVPFRMIRSIYFVLRTLPAIASLKPKVRVERDRRNFVRASLGVEVYVLLFDLLRLCLDLLHLLRIGLGYRAAGCRN